MGTTTIKKYSKEVNNEKHLGTISNIKMRK